MIASEGYLHVPQCIEDKDLHALRAEADSLFNLKRVESALSEDEYFDKVRRCFQFQHPISCLRAGVVFRSANAPVISHRVDLLCAGLLRRCLCS